MGKLLRQTKLMGLFTDMPSMLAQLASRKLRPAEPYEIIWWIFVASVSIAILPRFFGEAVAQLSYVLAIGGAAGCGWAWLLSRALFRAEKPIAPWNVAAVGAIVVVEAYWELTSVSEASGIAGEMSRIAANAASLICIGALVLVLVESLTGYSARLPRPERRFRQIFASVFCAMVAITLIWASNADEMSFADQWVDVVVGICALTGVIGSRMAISFRRRHPLGSGTTQKVLRSRSTAHDRRLAQRILGTVDQAQQFTTPDWKVADLAAAIGEQDYKVTQCITGHLGYRNFNHLVNTRRIKHAKQALADPKNKSRSILSISFDCGFNSIGPFNRAFKQDVGMTPREYRAQAAES